jgi:crotonobetainyl-CoA:carnitine CoA-transferase CaiB-like acyl-CoA transferase
MLSHLRVASTALNLPGPAACARLRTLGARVSKIEPPSGDPLALYCPAWYAKLHAGIEIRRLDLKSDGGRDALAALLERADVLVTAQRPSALSRLGLSPADLSRFSRLCHVAITGHRGPEEETPGHDLTYLASAGLISPPSLPPTLFADMAGAERAVAMALALLNARERSGQGGSANVALADVAADLAGPLHAGLTRPGALLGGARAGYNLYATRAGWIAVAALEPHFEQRLQEALALEPLTVEALAARFAAQTAEHWERWAREHDLPIVALPSSLLPKETS